VHQLVLIGHVLTQRIEVLHPEGQVFGRAAIARPGEPAGLRVDPDTDAIAESNDVQLTCPEQKYDT